MSLLYKFYPERFFISLVELVPGFFALIDLPDYIWAEMHVSCIIAASLLVDHLELVENQQPLLSGSE